MTGETTHRAWRELRRGRMIGMLLSVVGLAAPGAAASAGAGDEAAELREKAAIGWDFNGDRAGWSGNGDVTGLSTAGGALVGRSEGSDPILYSPEFEVQATPFQVLEIRMRSDTSGLAEIYWANTHEPPYGGFRPAQRVTFPVQASGELRTYRVIPFWHPQKRVIKIRIDPPRDSRWAIESIRILEPARAGGESNAGALNAAAWPTGFVDGSLVRVSPPLSLDAAAAQRLVVRARVSGSPRGIVYWVTEDETGAFGPVQRAAFPLEPDGRERAYIVDLASSDSRPGRIAVLALDFFGDGREELLEVTGAGAPTRPELEVVSFDLRDAVNRAGRPATLVAVVRNRGSQTQGAIRARAFLGDAGLAEQVGPAGAGLAHGEAATFSWPVTVHRAGQHSIRLEVSAEETPPVVAERQVAFTEPVPAQPARLPDGRPYVPEPQPVTGEYDVGVYYFPGWESYGKWAVLDDFPERRPVLGYYREGDPQVADWHLKWAAEHGIAFFVYDWYWVQGGRSLEHALHDGYLKSRYRDRVKFALLWANHNPPGTSSETDLLNVTRHWIDHYFKRPEYYTVNGRPLVIIFSPDRLTQDMGAPAVKAAFQKMRALVREAGLPDLFLVACTGPDRAGLAVLEEQGYDAATGYNYPAAGAGDRLVAPYDLAVSGYEEIWRQIADMRLLDYIPVTEPGWDARPWHGDQARVRTGRTPEKFQAMLEKAKEFVDERTPAGRRKIVLAEAWNEFGEGAAIEPHRASGFGYLDSIRAVFTAAPAAHADATPADVGLELREWQAPPSTLDWAFDVEGDPLGWYTQHITGFAAEGKVLKGTATSADPGFYSPRLKFQAAERPVVEITMKMDEGSAATLYWATSDSPLREQNSSYFPVLPDGQFHVYRLELGRHPHWQGEVVQLRIDPNNVPGSQIEIASVRVLRV